MAVGVAGPPAGAKEGAQGMPDPTAVFADLPTLETERLVLRRLTLADAEDVYAYGRDPQVARYTSWRAHASIEDSRHFLTWCVERYADGAVAPWGIALKAEGRVIGSGGFVTWNLGNDRAEIGYTLGRPYWGQGLAPEAMRAVLDFGFTRMDLHRIEARCFVANAASARVMEKIGMRYEGIMREGVLVKGRYEDVKWYAILRREWAGPR
jgi:[ribosomal protein S5]-alanine N-acetyltransferase